MRAFSLSTALGDAVGRDVIARSRTGLSEASYISQPGALVLPPLRQLVSSALAERGPSFLPAVYARSTEQPARLRLVVPFSFIRVH